MDELLEEHTKLYKANLKPLFTLLQLSGKQSYVGLHLQIVYARSIQKTISLASWMEWVADSFLYLSENEMAEAKAKRDIDEIQLD